eukprot:TRINITY_DN1506_c0_g1_i1.p1 TRINITY_DN1506_c0_g1~~TRINITY_DN1506_c0_g1_i1.p1  ORF type:complete len:291 (-),score=74.44 TRINITY_DN1506_c0_g1_i1:338-1210(-)
MEFPFGHHRHHQKQEEEEEFPLPPHHQHQRPDYIRDEGEFSESHEYERPPHYKRNEDVEQERYHENMYQTPPPDYDYPPPPPPRPFESEPVYSSVQHVSHQPDPSEFGQEKHHRLPFSVFHHKSHESSEVSSAKKTVKVYCKAETNHSLTIRDGVVVLAPADANDEFQHWIKDETFSTRVKDEESFPSFSLVNKATGQALKHSIGPTHPVQLTPFNPDALDESVLWTQSNDLGDGYRCIRMVNNIRLNLDAFNGDKEHGGVHDGTKAVLWEWMKGDNQRWKIVPYLMDAE